MAVNKQTINPVAEPASARVPVKFTEVYLGAVKTSDFRSKVLANWRAYGYGREADRT